MTEHHFEVARSETVYVGEILALRTDDVVMPGGHTARRVVVEHFGAVAVVALDEDNNVVLVHQYRHPVQRRLWELPAGLLDAGAEAPQLGAARELHEETGLTARRWSVLVDVVCSPGFSDESVRIYLASGLTEVGRPEAEDEEADLTVSRWPLADAVTRVLAGDVVNSIAAAGILAAWAVHTGVAQTRPVDAPWPDRSWRFAERVLPR